MLQSIEEKASNYASSLQTLETEILKDVKKLKACKQQRMKKFFDRVSFLQKEVEGSVSEVRSQLIQYRIVGSFVYGQLCWAGSNLFVGRLVGAACNLHFISVKTIRKEIKCTQMRIELTPHYTSPRSNTQHPLPSIGLGRQSINSLQSNIPIWPWKGIHEWGLQPLKELCKYTNLICQATGIPSPNPWNKRE